MASFSIRSWGTANSSSLLSAGEDHVEIFQGELFTVDIFQRWRKGFWKLCWTSSREDEAVLHEFSGDNPINPSSSISLGDIKTVVSVEKNELSTLALFRDARVSSKYRIGIELVDGRVVCLATSTIKGRVEWLERLYSTLVEQAKGGHHKDPAIIDHIKAMFEQFQETQFMEDCPQPVSTSEGSHQQQSVCSSNGASSTTDLLGLDDM